MAPDFRLEALAPRHHVHAVTRLLDPDRRAIFRHAATWATCRRPLRSASCRPGPGKAGRRFRLVRSRSTDTRPSGCRERTAPTFHLRRSSTRQSASSLLPSATPRGRGLSWRSGPRTRSICRPTTSRTRSCPRGTPRPACRLPHRRPIARRGRRCPVESSRKRCGSRREPRPDRIPAPDPS